MNRNRFAAALVPALLLPAAAIAWSPWVTAQQAQDPEDLLKDDLDVQDYEVGESPERYAQVKVVEGDVLLRKGESDEPLSRGIPVGEGDVVESNGRGILQLGDGSVVAFGRDTRFRVAALFSEQDEVRRVLLVLERGQLRVRKGVQSEAIIRVDTPAGSGSLGTRGGASARGDATWQVRGGRVVFMVHGGQATYTNAESKAQVYAGQRLTVYGGDDALDRISEFNTYSLDEFDQWADDLVKPRMGESASRVPPEIRYYADDLDSTGRWTYVDEVSSWCWTPTAVAVDWRPYTYGRWGAFGGGMTWISSEPWGYVTYHHGRWGWGAGIGWYWIPGVYYSPAWVAWNCSGSNFGWAPLGYHNRPARWGYGAWGGGHCWNVVDIRYINDRNLHRHFRTDAGFIRTFDRPGPGPRPWWHGRMMVGRDEFRDPIRFQRVATTPTLRRERVDIYVHNAERTTGRTIYRPPVRPAEPGRPAQPRGFNQIEHRTPPPSRPIFQRNPDPTDRRIPTGRPGEAPRTPRDERPRVERLDTPRPEAPRQEGLRPQDRREQPRPEAPRPETPRQEGLRPERREQPRPEAPRQEPPRVEPPRMERPRPEPPRQEAPKPEAPRQEAPRPERREQPRPEPPRQEAPRQEPPRMERPRPEPPRQEAPRQESRPAPRQEAPRQESRPAPRQEAPRQESRPAPRQESKPGSNNEKK